MEKEIQLEQENIEIVSDVDIDVNKVGNTATVTITNSEGSTKSVDIYDGEKGQDGKDGNDGKDATINGENTINIVAGDNIEIEQEDDTLTISSTGGTSDYTQLENKPKINNVELIWNKSTSDLGINIPDVSNFITKDVNNLTYYTLSTGTGHSIELSINSSTYVVTLNLKNSAGTVISTDTIDLPLESVVVNGTYDSTNKKIVLTLQSGSTIDIPVGDLISGLQTEITSNNKLSADLVDDTSTTNKFVTANDKTAWSGKQDALVSGTNIKTINNTSLLGSGDITISGGSDTYILETENSVNTQISTSANIQVLQDIYNAWKNNGKTETSNIYYHMNKRNTTSEKIYTQATSLFITDSYMAITFTDFSDNSHTSQYGVQYRRIFDYIIGINISNDTIGNISITKYPEYLLDLSENMSASYLPLGSANSTSYTPTANYNPATKKYVDDSVKPLILIDTAGGTASTLSISLSSHKTAIKNLLTKLKAENYTQRVILVTNDVSNGSNNRPLVIECSVLLLSNTIRFQGVYAYPSAGAYTKYGINYIPMYLYTIDCAYDSNNNITSISGTKEKSYKLYDEPNCLGLSNITSYTPSGNYNPATKLYTDKTHYENMAGYDATKTQILKNINGTLTWVDE